MTGKRIAVVMGGPSAEREVSLRTGAAVRDALVRRGYDTVAIDWTGDASLAQLLRDAKAEAVWLALHGTFGEDGCVQGLLECERIPYTGSGVLASALGMDKAASKRIFDHFAIATPAWTLYRDEKDARAIGLPIVVKPSREGSSVGVTIVHEEGQFDGALSTAQKCHGDVLLETYIKGRDLSVAVLDDAVLGTVEIKPAVALYDYQAKYERKDTQYLVPAPLDETTAAKVSDLALRAHRALGCAGATRSDLVIGEDGRAWVLEVNTLPGMTATSLLPKIARHAGLSYDDLVERILQSARVHT
jgi:D-alanine-D-alanine ligase